METQKTFDERLDKNQSDLLLLISMTADKNIDIKSKGYLNFKKEVDKERSALKKEFKELHK